MDKKRHKSGAEKRKNKAGKNETERKLLSKIPKLTSIFLKESAKDGGESTATEGEHSGELDVSATSSENFAIPSTSTSTATEADFFDNDSVSEIDNAECSENVTAEISAIPEPHGHMFSNDPGLWPVEHNQSILQDLWIKKGNLSLSRVFLNLF